MSPLNRLISIFMLNLTTVTDGIDILPLLSLRFFDSLDLVAALLYVYTIFFFWIGSLICL